MSGYTLFRTALLAKCLPTHAKTWLCINNNNAVHKIPVRGAKKAVKFGKGGTKEEMKGPEVCTDITRLTTYAVGVNIFKQGEDPKLKPPEEYPEWLYQIHLGPPKKLDEHESESWGYWRRLRKEGIWRSNRLKKGKKF